MPANAGTDAKVYADPNVDAYSEADTVSHANTHPLANAHSEADAGAHPEMFANANALVVADTYLSLAKLPIFVVLAFFSQHIHC